MLGGAAISWISKKQTVTATPTCEAKYVAASICTQHVNWLWNLFKGLECPQEKSTVIFCNNHSTISLSKDFQFHSQSKHINIQHHFICDKVSNGTVKLKYIPSTENITDLLTKPLDQMLHERLSQEVGLIPG